MGRADPEGELLSRALELVEAARPRDDPRGWEVGPREFFGLAQAAEDELEREAEARARSEVDREALKGALVHSKIEVSLRGHTWDVADVMEVIDAFFDPSLAVARRSG